MTEPQICKHCVTPELCVIACPYNRNLEQMKHPVCEQPPPDEDQALEIVFQDGAPPVPDA